MNHFTKHIDNQYAQLKNIIGEENAEKLRLEILKNSLESVPFFYLENFLNKLIVAFENKPNEFELDHIMKLWKP